MSIDEKKDFNSCLAMIKYNDNNDIMTIGIDSINISVESKNLDILLLFIMNLYF